VFTRTPNSTGATLDIFIKIRIRQHVSAMLGNSHVV